MKTKKHILRTFLIILMFTLSFIFASSSTQAASKAFTLNKTSVKLALTKSYTLKASNYAAGAKVTWKTSDKKIATVKEGVVTANAEGTAIITATCGKASKSCKITVYQPAKSVKLATNSYIEVGDTFTVEAVFQPKNTTYKNITWSVEGDYWWPSVEQVSGNKFKAIEEGTATIIAYQKDTNKTYKLEITVHNALGSFHIESDTKKVDTLVTYPGYHLIVNTVFDEDDYWRSNEGNTFTYTSEDTSIATVDSNGQITGIKEGTTAITATGMNGKSVTCKLKVTKKPEETVKDMFLADQMTEIIGDGGYSLGSYWDDYNFASVDNTQIIPLADQQFALFNCTYQKDGELIVNLLRYNQSYEPLDSKIIELSFNVWGGVYLGADGYYYMAVGQTNEEESDSKTVYSIIKYNRELKEEGRCNITGAECKTTVPFDAGNCSMDMNGTTLVVHTSRERYTSDDGLNHQSNITFVIDTVTMKQSYVGELFPYNHVSHSFNQFVKFDSGNLIYVDHGDAYPRSIVMQTHCNFTYQPPIDDYWSRPTVIEQDLIDIKGETGDNHTGTRVAGLELGIYHNLVAGTSIPHDTLTGDFNDYDTRNVFVSVVAKDGSTSELKWLTHYEEGSNIDVKNLRFIKLNENEFALIYQIDRKETSSIGFLLIDSNGDILQAEEFVGYFSGNVQPVVYQDVLLWIENSLADDPYSDYYVYDYYDEGEDEDAFKYTNYFVTLHLK